MSEQYKGPKVMVWRSPLFRKFFLITSGILMASLILVGTTLLVFVSGYWMKQRSELLENNARAVAANTEEVLVSSYTGSSIASIMMVCNNLNQISNAISADVFIANTQGDVVYCREILQTGFSMYTGACMVHSAYSISEQTMRSAVAETQSGTGDLDGCLSGLNFVVSSPVKIDGKTVAVVFVTQSFSNALAPYILAIFRMFFTAALFGLIISGIACYAVTAKTTRPLRMMSVAAKQYANGDFSYRIPEKARKTDKHDEIGNLVAAFNSMAQALATLESSRRSFVANVSHELKTPMTTIGGFIDGMLDGTISEDKREQYLSIVSGEVKRLSRLVTGMLNMSRIESGEVTLNPVDFDISDMLVNTLISFEQVIESRGIEIRGLENIVPNRIFADRDMINQVVYNLVDNAVKFTPEGGFIEIASGSDSEKIIVRVANSGAGIGKEDIDRIFERFYKADKSRSYDTRSAGMGLYIVKTIIELHGGRIRVTSVPGERTDFVFWLPKI